MSLRIRWAAFAAALLLSMASAGITPAQTADGISGTLHPVVPFRAGNRIFFAADSGTLYCRDGADRPAQMLLPARSYGTLAPSRNGRYLAYTRPATAGATSYEVRIRDVETHQDLPDVLVHANITQAPWTDNHKGFFYTREDTADHRQRVYYHRTGQEQSRDEVIYSRFDQPDWRYLVRVSDDGQYAVFTIEHSQDDHTRLYFIDLDNSGKPDLHAPVVKLVDEFGARYLFVDNGNTSFFLHTTRAAPNGRIVVANTEVTRESRWPVVLREKADTLQYAKTAGEEFVIAVYRNGTRSIARIYSPPNDRQMRAEARRQLDSLRRADGDTVYDGRGNDPRDQQMGRRGPGGDRIPGGSTGLLGFRLDLRQELPIPNGATLIGINSIADQEELFYTVTLADGSVRSYIYNVKKATNTPFNINTQTDVRR